MISEEFTGMLRPEPHFHDVDGACQWQFVMLRVRQPLPNIDGNVTGEEWLEQFLIGIEQSPI